MFFPSGKVHLIPSCKYLAKTLSDHADLLETIHAAHSQVKAKMCRFPSYLLNNEDAIAFMNTNIDFLLAIMRILLI